MGHRPWGYTESDTPEVTEHIREKINKSKEKEVFKNKKQKA